MKKIQMARLKNGIPVYFQPDRSSHVATASVKAGSLTDPPDLIGRAHIFEHIASNSTRDYSGADVNKMLRTYSADHWREAGIYTSLTNTNYGCGLMRRRDYIYNLFPLFTQMVRYPNLSHEVMENIVKIEQGAVLCEWASHGEDNIEDRVMRRLVKMIYPNNPVSNRLDCEVSHLMKPNIARELSRYHREYYVSSNIAVIILGPDKAKAMRMAQNAFGDMPIRHAPKLSFSGIERFPILQDVLREEFTYGDEFNKSFHLLMGFPTDSYGSNYDDALDVLAELLDIHLQYSLRDLAPEAHLGTYHPRVWTERSNLHGIVYVWVPTISLDGARRAEEIVVEEINKMHRGKFLDFGLDALATKACASEERKAALKILKRMGRSHAGIIKRPIIDNYMDAFVNSPQILAELITDYFANGVDSPESLNNFRVRMHKVKKGTIIDVSQKFLNPLRYGIVLAKPINPLNFDQFRQTT